MTAGTPKPRKKTQVSRRGPQCSEDTRRPARRSPALDDLRASFGRAQIWPGRALGEQVREVDLEDAELVVPGVAEDPEVVAAFLLVVVAGRSEGFEAADLGLDVSPGRADRAASEP